MGWALLRDSKPLSEFTEDVVSVRRPGRDGVVAGVASSTQPVTIPLVVMTPKRNMAALVGLFRQGGVLSVTDEPGRVVGFEFLSSSYTSLAAKADEVVAVTFLIRLPGVFWRATAAETFTVSLTSSSVDVACWPSVAPEPIDWDDPSVVVVWDAVPAVSGWELVGVEGMSAPVQDAIIRVKGSASGVRVSDSSGAWLILPDVGAGEWVRFEADSGRAWRTTTDTWSGGVEVSGLVDFGGPRGVFEITPSFTDPNNRAGRLTVTTATRSGAVVEVRGRAAYLI